MSEHKHPEISPDLDFIVRAAWAIACVVVITTLSVAFLFLERIEQGIWARLGVTIVLVACASWSVMRLWLGFIMKSRREELSMRFRHEERIERFRTQEALRLKQAKEQ